MAITISGENNNDRILASDGVIDQISGINIVGLITASHINVGSNIQLGNAGIITATTFVGNITGNVNNTSPLLLQTGGSERFRITGNNELGIAGANYGTSGQVLTSGGSGSAVSWATPAVTAFTSGANNRVVTATSGSGLNGESNLTYDGTNLQLQTDANNEGIKINSTLSGGSSYPVFEMEANRGVGNTLGKLVQKWNGTQVASIQFSSGTDGTNKDDAHIHFNTASAGTVIERMKITSTGRVGINTTSPGRRLHVYGGFGAANLGHPLILERGDNSNTQIEVRSGGAIRGLWGASSTANFMVYDNDTSHIHFVVNQTGFVGIGRDDPNTMLDIKAPPLNTATINTTNCLQLGLRLTPDGTGSNTEGHIYNGIAVGDGYAGLYGKDGGSSAATDLAFFTGTASAVSERMRIQDDGKIIIGNATMSINRNVSISAASGNSQNVELGLQPTNSSGGYNPEVYIGATADGTYGAAMYFYTRDTSGNRGERLRIDSSGHLLPGSDSNLNLGSSAKRWANIYTGDLQLSNVSSPTDQNGEEQDVIGNEVDGTQGTWTIQEGSNDLFIINRVNGKKYKFNLTEVS